VKPDLIGWNNILMNDALRFYARYYFGTRKTDAVGSA
jgi:hypothetical protein